MILLNRALRAAREFRERLPRRLSGQLFWPMPGDHVFDNFVSGKGFERAELRFTEAMLRPGDAFWDVGANFGLYSVIAAARVGRRGSVLAFEPEPGNYRRLWLNLLVNRITCARTHRVAVGAENLDAVEFQSCEQGAYSGLKVAKVPGAIRQIRVRQVTLDSFAAAAGWPPVTLLKMDIEGAELLAFRGGSEFFSSRVRPVALCEFSDRRTVAHGYAARELYAFLAERDYRWFAIDPAGRLVPSAAQDSYDYENLVACPAEKLAVLTERGCLAAVA